MFLVCDFNYKLQTAHKMFSISLSIKITLDSTRFDQRLSKSHDEACVFKIKAVGSRYPRVINWYTMGFYIRDKKADC